MNEPLIDDAADGDFILPFQIGETAVRGRVVRLSGALDEILSAHNFPAEVSVLVGEAAAIVAMMGSALKFDGKLIFQAQGDGPVAMVVADYSAGGALRATASLKGDKFAPGALALLGKGHIAITIDQGPDMERYQGVTPIEGASLGEAVVAWSDQSEQIPTIIKLAVGRMATPGEPERWRAGGIVAQFVPGEGGTRARGEEILMDADDRETWARAAAFIKTVRDDELLDPAISAGALLYRLFHEDGVRVFEPQALSAACNCNSGKIAAVLERYSEDDLRDMVEDGAIRVSCEFCRKDYLFTPQGEHVRRP